MKVNATALLLPLFASPVFAAPLQLDVYNPRESYFPGILNAGVRPERGHFI